MTARLINVFEGWAAADRATRQATALLMCEPLDVAGEANPMGRVTLLTSVIICIGCGSKPSADEHSAFRNGTTEERIARYRLLKSRGSAAFPAVRHGIRDPNAYVRGYSLLVAAELRSTDLIPVMLELLDSKNDLVAVEVELFPSLMADYSGKVLSKYPKTDSGGVRATLWAILSHAIHITANRKATIDNVRTWWQQGGDVHSD